MFLENIIHLLLKGVGSRCFTRHEDGKRALWIDKQRLMLAKRLIKWSDSLDVN